MKQKHATKDRHVFTRLDPETYERLRLLAERDQRSQSYLVRVAIDQYLRRRSAGATGEAA